MTDMIESAQQLGKAIAESDRFRAVADLRTKIDTDETLQAEMKALNELGAKIAKLEKEVQPVEPEDKRRLQELQQNVTGNALLQDLARVEADFAELMNRVNTAIHSQLTG